MGRRITSNRKKGRGVGGEKGENIERGRVENKGIEGDER